MVTEAPLMSGPVTGGAHGWPFGVPIGDPADHGYRQDEYFVEGVATAYRPVPGTELGPDGQWETEPASAATYRTRIVVHRPVDPARFSGTAYVFWNNVSAGFDIYDGADAPGLIARGDVFVAVTCQRAGVHGTSQNLGLRTWDPERYGTLSLASDDYSFDVFAQVGAAIRGSRSPGSVDPLDGLVPRRVIAEGASQSAGRLATFINAVAAHTPVFDGYLLTVYMGFGLPLQVGDEVIDLAGPGRNPGPALVARNYIRAIEQKVMVVESELEARVAAPFRQSDTDTYRCWETAGTCHASVQGSAARGPRLARDFAQLTGFLTQGAGRELPPGVTANQVPLAPVIDAAKAALVRWIDGADAPASSPRVEVSDGAVVRDADGIARGGIRLPQVAVPVAVNGSAPLGDDLMAELQGSCVPFTAGQLAQRYADGADYLRRFRAAADRAVAEGFLPAADADALSGEAAARAQNLFG
ncbi:alpha/beta hydrolase domain-containing protein [Tsukamurella sp. NPDC003166]|uniref:alpha/beta hydrolase domain-containing protein n=1 Tax=Tsukamurella sp. NPDC003166 TaxID=3154444 RepID=UPI0033AD204E